MLRTGMAIRPLEFIGEKGWTRKFPTGTVVSFRDDMEAGAPNGFLNDGTQDYTGIIEPSVDVRTDL